MHTSSHRHGNSAGSLVAVLILLLAGQLEALKLPALETDYSSLIPNGNEVRVNGQWWPAILKNTWRGEATSELNAFGTAFTDAGSVWTTALCQADSDGDGFTNGQELGDPDCVWTPSSSTPPARTQDISHPGLWSSTPTVDTFPGINQATPASCAVDTPPTASTNEARKSLLHTVDVPAGATGVTSPGFGKAKVYPVDDDTPFYLPTVSGCYYNNASIKHWHDAATWPGNTVPAPGADVSIPADTVVMISSCSVSREGYGKVTIPEGSSLVFNDAPILFRVKDIVVEGALWIGTSTCPIKQPVVIEFFGTKAELATYSNGLVAKNYGIVEMHGAPNKLTWTRLKTTAIDGSAWIVVQDEVEWSAGEDIVITTTVFKDDRVGNQNEVRTIVAVDPNNKTRIAIHPPLEFHHYGGLEYQAEVALLWRSITLRGAAEKDAADGFGGHTMAAGTATTYRVMGVRAERMGQTNIVARYPFHIHLARENGNFSFIQQVACVDTFYRCAVIHGTNFSQARKNVAFNIIGHAYYLEDGSEMWNNITFNIASHVHSIGEVAVGAGQNGFKFTEDDSCRLPADHAAVCYYISNAHNYIIGNAASGGWSSYQFPIFPRPIQLSKHIDIVPSTYRTLRFDGNSAHSAGHNWNTFGACVYHGGKLWEDPTSGLLKYDAVRTVVDVKKNAEDYAHLIENSRLFLCNLGFLSWGHKGDIRNIEGSDNRLTAFLLADGGIINGVITARSENYWRGYQGERNSRLNGFRFYDASARNIYSRIHLRNFWEEERGDHVDGWSALYVGSNRDVEKTTQISGVQALKFENVDYAIRLSRRPRELSSTWCFNVIDWDGSLTNRKTCEPMVVGSYIDWWRRDESCYYDKWWPAWVCPRIPGVEVVALEAVNDDLFYRLEWSPKSNNNLNWTQAERDQLFVGHVSHFGTDSHRRFTVTRNNHLATGWSGIGWYLYLQTGAPTTLTFIPRVFPKGTFILLAVSYPAGSTFVVYSKLKWGAKRQEFAEVSSREAVLQSSDGAAYHFDGKHLYLRVSQAYRFANILNRDSADVYDVQTGWGIYVEATCTSTKKAGYCDPPAEPEAPTHLASGKLLTPYINVCADDADFDTDVSTSTLDNPYHCSLNKTCSSFAKEHRPEYVDDWCGDLMRSKPFSQSCWVPTCNWTSNKLKRVRLPTGSPCSPRDGSGDVNQENATCTGDGVCQRQLLLSPLAHYFQVRRISDDVSNVRVTVQPVPEVGKVELLHAEDNNNAIELSKVGGFFQAQLTASPILHSATFRITSATNSSTYEFVISDWNANSQTLPKVTVVESTAAQIVLNVDPVNWVDKAFLTANVNNVEAAPTAPGTLTNAGDAMTVIHANRMTFSTSDGSLPDALSAAGANIGVKIIMTHGMSVHVSLPCMGSSRDSSLVAKACKTQAVDVFDKPSVCRYRLINEPGTTRKLVFKIAPAPIWKLDTEENFVHRVIARSANVGADVEFLTWDNYTFYCKHGDIDNLKNLAGPLTIDIFSTKGDQESHEFIKDDHYPQNYQVLGCASGVRPAVEAVQGGGVVGQCNAANDCVTEEVSAVPTPAPTTTEAPVVTPAPTPEPTTTEAPVVVVVTPAPTPEPTTTEPPTTPIPTTPETTTTAAPTPEPTTAEATTVTPPPTTVLATSPVPTTTVDTTSAPTDAPITTTVEDTAAPATVQATEQPTTIAPASDTPTTVHETPAPTDSPVDTTQTIDSTPLPTGGETSSPTPAPTTPQPVIEGRLVIRGATNTVHSALLTTKRAALEDSLKTDLAAMFQLSSKHNVVIVNLTIGSLLVDFEVNDTHVIGAAGGEIEDAMQSMQTKLDAVVSDSAASGGTLPSGTLASTALMYTTEDPAAPSITLHEGTVAVQATTPPIGGQPPSTAPSISTPTPNDQVVDTTPSPDGPGGNLAQSPSTDDSDSGSGCGVGCYVPIIICVVVVLVAALGFVLYIRGNKEDKDSSSHTNHHKPGEPVPDRSMSYSTSHHRPKPVDRYTDDDEEPEIQNPVEQFPSAQDSLRRDFATSRRAIEQAQPASPAKTASPAPGDGSVLAKSGVGANAVHRVVTDDSVRSTGPREPRSAAELAQRTRSSHSAVGLHQEESPRAVVAAGNHDDDGGDPLGGGSLGDELSNNNILNVSDVDAISGVFSPTSEDPDTQQQVSPSPHQEGPPELSTTAAEALKGATAVSGGGNNDEQTEVDRADAGDRRSSEAIVDFGAV